MAVYQCFADVARRLNSLAKTNSNMPPFNAIATKGSSENVPFRQATSPLEICSLEADQGTMRLNPPTRLSRFEIIWITKGKAQLAVDHQRFDVDGNLLICLVPGQLRSLSAFTSLDGYYISVSSDFLNLAEGQTEFSILRSRHFSSHNVITLQPSVEQAGEFDDVIGKMFKEYSSYLLLRSELLRSFLKVVIIYISRSISIDERDILPGRDVEMVSRFMDLLKQKYRTVKKVSDYADELCVTPNYLNQMVKRVSGFPASYHIQQQIVLEAKRQASYSSLRLKEIADGLGFSDYAHFSKFFKTYSGVSFSRFRSSLAR